MQDGAVAYGDVLPDGDRSVRIGMDDGEVLQVAAGTEVIVERISDDDPALLQFFEDRGIVLGAHLTVREGAPFSESIDVHVRGEDQPVALGRIALDALYVSRG